MCEVRLGSGTFGWTMQVPWSTGFDINPKVAGLAPIASIVVGAVGVARNVNDANGDIRDGLLPWAMFVAMVCLAACCLGVLSVHRSRVSNRTRKRYAPIRNGVAHGGDNQRHSQNPPSSDFPLGIERLAEAVVDVHPMGSMSRYMRKNDLPYTS
jgi:hypothetical protein